MDKIKGSVWNSLKFIKYRKNASGSLESSAVETFRAWETWGDNLDDNLQSLKYMIDWF